MKTAIVLVLGCAVATNAFMFSQGNNKIFQRTRVNDDKMISLGLDDRFFHGNSLAAASSHDEAAKIDLEAANQDFHSIDFDHKTNKQLHFVDQSKTSFSKQEGSKNFLDFGAKFASSDKAAVNRDEVTKGATHVQAKLAQDRDFFEQTLETQNNFDTGFLDF